MHASFTNRSLGSLVFMFAAMVMYGCKTAADSQPRSLMLPAGHGGVDGGGGEPTSTIIDARPAALIDGEIATWGELRSALNELAGATALQELILDRRIAEALRGASLVITPDDIVVERKTLVESLHNDPNTAIRLLDELRARQNLGKTRFDGMLSRNAALRALVRGRVIVTNQAVQAMYELVHGAKRQARIMVLPDLQAAQAAIARINSGESFADVATQMSTDASAARGGLLEPVGRADPAYPEAVRQSLWNLDVNQVSAPILIDDGYAIIMLIKQIEGDGADFQSARPVLESLVRRNQERLLMDQLARQMLASTQVTIFDDALQESWSRQKRGSR